MASLKVTLIADTFATTSALDDIHDYDTGGDYPSSADGIAEFAGRACYQSWSKPNPETATNDGYLANIIEQGHFSVMEHATATFYVEGVSRYLTHELVRHRHLSYSQLSTRFVDESARQEFVTHPTLAESNMAGELEAMARYVRNICMTAYREAVGILEAEGLSRKQAREAARFYLPSDIETKIVVSGNHRAWRDFLHKRWSVHADAEIREFAGRVLEHLRDLAPNTYQDIPRVPFA